MATKKNTAAGPGLGAAGSHQGKGLTPDDYEAMIEDSAEGTLEELLGVSPEQARRLDAEIAAKTEQAERDIASALDARVNFRWGRGQVATIKRAADLVGVPYQTYMKVVLFRQALADIQAAGVAVTAPARKPQRNKSQHA